MTNKQRRSIVDDAKSKGYTGSYIDLFRQAALNPSDNQEVLTAGTPLEKEQGLRPHHEAGRTDASMAFTDVPPNTPFNTVGMKAPIDIKKYDEQGHLVKSYESVPPGIQNLNTGPATGTVLETPSRAQQGAFVEDDPNDSQIGDPGSDAGSTINNVLADLYSVESRASKKASEAYRANEVPAEGDSYRHALASAYAVNKLKGYGFSAPMAMLGANAMGLFHEITAKSNNSFRESAEDVLNNLAGSLVGVFQDDKGAEATTKMLANHILPDGMSQEYKNYQRGGFSDNTRVSMPELQDQEAFNPYSDLHLPPSGRIEYSGANVEDLLGIGSLLKAPVKAAAKNTYKINPFARKSIPVSESTWVRGVGKEGIDDLKSSGIVRSKNDGAYPQPYFGHSSVLKNVINTYSGGKGGAVLTLKDAPMKGVGSFPTGNPFIQTPAELIKLGDPRLKAYPATPHWLKGFKPIKKQEGGYNPNEYMNEMQPKVFPNQKRDAEWVNYATTHDFAGRFPGETRTNEQIGLERSNKNTTSLVPNPVRPKQLKRAQEGSVIQDFLLPALEADNAVDFGTQQAESQAKLVAKSEQDLAAEQQNVQRVRENIIPTAKNIASRWENMSSQDKAAYNEILDYAPNSSVTGLAPPTLGKTRGQQTSEVRQKLADRPESLKEYMPNYNIFLDQPDKFGTNRGVYCTTMGCYSYEQAGARQITDANGHPMRGNAQFVRATEQGVSGFEQVNPEDRQPGDLTVLRGSARADYNNPASRVTRDHHTVIYAGESERKENAKSIGRRALDWITGEKAEENPEYSKSNPGAIKAYSAEGGDMHSFKLATRNNENPKDGEGFKFYRYVGQTPQMTGRVEEAKQRQSQADMVAAALNEQSKRASRMQEEVRPEAPEKLESLGTSQIENNLPERKITSEPKEVDSKQSPKEKVEAAVNKVKGKVNELKDRRKSKQPKTTSAAKQIRKKYREDLKALRKGQ